MITKEEVLKIAKLARLELTEAEITKMQKDLSAILDYFNLLKKAGRLPMSIQLDRHRKSNQLRKDEAISQKREVVEKIIAASPDKKDDYIKVKAVL